MVSSAVELDRKEAAGPVSGERTRDVLLDMASVRLGCLDEYGVMVLFGNNHSLCLTEGLPNNPANIVDAKGNVLYPAYFMTHLRVPETLPLESFGLWDTLRISTRVKRFGATLLESAYEAGRADGEGGERIAMAANSLFILDPGRYRSRSRQVSAPAKGSVRELESLAAVPAAIQEAAKVRGEGFGLASEGRPIEGTWEYFLERGRDVDADHPLLFAKIPLIMDLAERHCLRGACGGRLPEEAMQSIRLSSRKTFYYGNAFAGRRLGLHSRTHIRELPPAGPGSLPGSLSTHEFEMETEMYDAGELMAIARSRKRLVFGIQEKSLIQDARRIFRAVAGKAGERT